MSEKDKDEADDAELDDLTPEGESADEVKGGGRVEFKTEK